MQDLRNLCLGAFKTGINLENVSASVEQEKGDMEHCDFKERHSFFCRQSVIFRLLPFVSVDSWYESTESFVLVVLLLNALMWDQTVKLNDLQVSCRMASPVNIAGCSCFIFSREQSTRAFNSCFRFVCSQTAKQKSSY